jgi:hypothetical protein
MKITKYNVVIFAQALLLAVMLLKPSIAMTGARNGLVLWAYTVLPGIFPASFLASAIMNGIRVDKKYMKLYVILCGILTGFPGAAILYCEYRKMYADDNSLDGMLAYCNISSPSFVCNFIYGFEVMQVISLHRLVVIVYLASILGILGCAVWEWAKQRKISKMQYVLAGAVHMRTPRESTHPTQTRSRLARNVADTKPLGGQGLSTDVAPQFAYGHVDSRGWALISRQNEGFTDLKKYEGDVSVQGVQGMDWGRLMESCCMNMIKAGGFIVFSACLAQYVVYLMPGDFLYRGVVTGIIEITTGINQVGADFRDEAVLMGTSAGTPLVFNAVMAVTVINAFGGLSTLLQTISVTGKWLDVRKYLLHKVVYCVITVVMVMVCLAR